jgi:catechol 2,3-dioxygenase-like lactoylglutathione lyase family enzyme
MTNVKWKIFHWSFLIGHFLLPCCLHSWIECCTISHSLPGDYLGSGGEALKAIFKTAFPYADDKMNLPVENLEAAIPFYERVMGFRVLSRQESPQKSAVLERDNIQIGLSENGGDPTQEGCFFEVDNAEAAFAELKANGLEREEAQFRIDQYGEKRFKVFFIAAPDGLCYCLGEQQL